MPSEGLISPALGHLANGQWEESSLGCSTMLLDRVR